MLHLGIVGKSVDQTGECNATGGNRPEFSLL